MAGVDSKRTPDAPVQGVTKASRFKVIGSHFMEPQPRSVHRCARHHDVDSLVRCDRCQMNWCEECIGRRTDHGSVFWLCNCGGRGVPLPDPAAADRRRYEQWLGDAARAPLSGTGLRLMLVGSVCYGTLDALLGTATRETLFAVFQRFTRHTGGGASAAVHDVLLSATGIVIFILVLGYQMAWVQQVIRDSARGRSALERFPNFTSMHDSIVVPGFEAFATLAACVAPGLLAMTIGPLPALVGLLLAVLGFLVFPMALASVALDGSLRGLDPLRIGQGIRACGLEYALVAALFVAALAAILGGSFLLDQVPWIGPFVKAFFILATSAMAAQVLGLVIARNDAKLHWLGEPRR